MAFTGALVLIAVTLSATKEAAPKAPESQKPAAPFQVQIDPKADEVMRALHGLYDNAKRFSVTAHVVRRRVVGEQSDVTELVQRVFIEEPNRVTVAHHSGPALPSIYCDGRDMYLYDVERNIYSRHDPPRNLKDFYTSRRLGAIAMGAAFLGPVIVKGNDPDRLAGVLAMLYAGTEDVEGLPCHKIKVLSTSAPLIYWIAAGERPLLRKVALDSEAALLNLRKEHPEATNISFEASVTYDEWKIEEPFARNPFAFKAPPGAMQVESVLPARADGPRTHALPKTPLPKPKATQEKSKKKR